jgi:hypothetical protein
MAFVAVISRHLPPRDRFPAVFRSATPLPRLPRNIHAPVIGHITGYHPFGKFFERPFHRVLRLAGHATGRLFHTAGGIARLPLAVMSVTIIESIRMLIGSAPVSGPLSRFYAYTAISEIILDSTLPSFISPAFLRCLTLVPSNVLPYHEARVTA